MKTINRLMDILEKICVAIGMVGALSAFLIVIAQVFCRVFLNFGFKWSEEVSLVFIVWAAMFASITLFRYSAHPRIEMFYDRYPIKVRYVMDLLFHLIEGFVLVILMAYGVQVVQRTSNAILPASEINRAVLFFPAVAASALHLLQVAVLVVETVLKLSGRYNIGEGAGEE